MVWSLLLKGLYLHDQQCYNKRMKWTANSAAQIAIGFANFKAICTAPFAAIDAGVMHPSYPQPVDTFYS